MLLVLQFVFLSCRVVSVFVNCGPSLGRGFWWASRTWTQVTSSLTCSLVLKLASRWVCKYQMLSLSLFPETQDDFRLLVLSNRQSKIQRSSVYNHIWRLKLEKRLKQSCWKVIHPLSKHLFVISNHLCPFTHCQRGSFLLTLSPVFFAMVGFLNRSTVHRGPERSWGSWSRVSVLSDCKYFLYTQHFKKRPWGQ